MGKEISISLFRFHILPYLFGFEENFTFKRTKTLHGRVGFVQWKKSVVYCSWEESSLGVGEAWLLTNVQRRVFSPPLPRKRTCDGKLTWWTHKVLKTEINQKEVADWTLIQMENCSFYRSKVNPVPLISSQDWKEDKLWPFQWVWLLKLSSSELRFGVES